MGTTHLCSVPLDVGCGVLRRGKWRTRISGWATRALHDAARDKRGRIQARSYLGHILAGTTYIVKNEASIGDLIKRKLRFVGYAKSGWARAYLALGGKLPGWLRQEHGHGLFQRSGGNEKPAVKVGNTLGWLQPTGAELRIMEMATAGMHRSFPQYIERTIRALIRKERVGKK